MSEGILSCLRASWGRGERKSGGPHHGPAARSDATRVPLERLGPWGERRPARGVCTLASKPAPWWGSLDRACTPEGCGGTPGRPGEDAGARGRRGPRGLASTVPVLFWEHPRRGRTGPSRPGALLGLYAALSILGGRVLKRIGFGYIMMQEPGPIPSPRRTPGPPCHGGHSPSPQLPAQLHRRSGGPVPSSIPAAGRGSPCVRSARQMVISTWGLGI